MQMNIGINTAAEAPPAMPPVDADVSDDVDEDPEESFDWTWSTISAGIEAVTFPFSSISVALVSPVELEFEPSRGAAELEISPFCDATVLLV
jgi:hypothetical protein